jgi:hypothetical protein
MPLAFYCTAIDPDRPNHPDGRRRIACILGPYPDQATAEAHRHEAYEIATTADPWAHWWRFGVTKIEAEVLPEGRGNQLLRERREKVSPGKKGRGVTHYTHVETAR